MINLNKVHLIGRLGNDPILRVTQKGTKVATFSLATQDFIKTKNESETTWHRIVVWGQSADFCHRYIKKGDAVHVEGSMKVRKYEGSDGKMNYMHEIHTLRIQTLGLRRAESMEAESINEDEVEVETAATIEPVEQYHQS